MDDAFSSCERFRIKPHDRDSLSITDTFHDQGDPSIRDMPHDQGDLSMRDTSHDRDDLSMRETSAKTHVLRLAVTPLSRLRGLLAHKPTRGLLLIAPCHDIHTFGMTDPIDVAFIDKEGVVLEAYRRVKPCNRLRCRNASAVFERFSLDEPWFQKKDRLGAIIQSYWGRRIS